MRALESFGVVPRKTATLRWPDLPEPMLRHFLRGYFDGDGSWLGLDLGARFVLCGNRRFLVDCQEYLMLAAGLPKTKLRAHNGTWYLHYAGRRQCMRIAGLLYCRARLFLQRKRAIAASFGSLVKHSDQ